MAAAKAPAKRYFECEEDGSSKFWEGEERGKALKKAFGRRVTGVDNHQGDEEDEYRSPSVAE